MTTRTAEDERRAGIRDLIVGAVVLVLMLGLWWLVARTNSEGTHDAELLPFIALIPLVLGVYHLIRARSYRGVK
jgi:hypothetical protein